MKFRSGYYTFILAAIAFPYAAILIIIGCPKIIRDIIITDFDAVLIIIAVIFALVVLFLYLGPILLIYWFFKTISITDEAVKESIFGIKKGCILRNDIKEIGIGILYPPLPNRYPAKSSEYIYFSNRPITDKERSAIVDTWRKNKKDIIFIDYSDKLFSYLCCNYEGEIMYETVSREELKKK